MNYIGVNYIGVNKDQGGRPAHTGTNRRRHLARGDRCGLTKCVCTRDRGVPLKATLPTSMTIPRSNAK